MPGARLAVSCLAIVSLFAVANCQDGATSNNTNDSNDLDRVFEINCTLLTPGCSSPTLDEIATRLSSDSSGSKSTRIDIRVKDLELSKTARFDSLTSVTIQGSESKITCTAGNVGIMIQNVTNVHIESLALYNCGATIITPNSKTRVSSALQIAFCGNININRVSITYSNGAGLNLHSNQGNVNVSSSQFSSNSLQDTKSPTNNNTHLGGNGVLLYIVTSANNTVYMFMNCTFAQNVAGGFRYDYILPTRSDPMESDPRERWDRPGGRGRGGGMVITIKLRVRRVQVWVTNCTFENNQAFLGAGLSAEIEGQGKENMVFVDNTHFTGNGCPKTPTDVIGIGGGAHLSFENLGRRWTKYFINFTNATFKSNCAELGGGAYFFSDRSRTESINHIKFEDCEWTMNYAHKGSAIDITSNVFKRAQAGYLPKPVFRRCSFTHNSVYADDLQVKGYYSSDKQSYGSGTLYSSLIGIQFQSSVLFHNNKGSGIIVVNEVVDFTYSDATFTRNQGIQGGALMLIGTAFMIVGSGHNYSFVGNRASDKGGAIHSQLVDITDFIASRSCFIQYQDTTSKTKRADIIHSIDWTASMVFENNTAGMGNSIHATSIIPCQVGRHYSPENERASYELLEPDKIFKPPGINIPSSKEEIVTEASSINSREFLKVFPGEVADLQLKIVDDFGNDVRATLTAVIQEENTNIRIESAYSCITDRAIKLRGSDGDNGTLILQTTGVRTISSTIAVTLLPCPPAFKLMDDECKCQAHDYVGIEICTADSATLKYGFWVGYVDKNKTELGTSICPAGFCNYNEIHLNDTEAGMVPLPKDKEELEEAVCGIKREGILCGKCSENYTTYYHSPHFDCQEAQPYSCRLGWLFYILSELVPVTLLFLFVLALNINFNTGAVNGFILFSQLLDTLLIDASGIIKVPSRLKALTRGYQVIYGFFTLDLFTTDTLAFCLWKDATVLDMLSFKYITVAYSLLLVLSVILFMKYSAARCFGRYYSITAFRNSVIHGLSGFLVLCYGQCIKVSFSILYSQDISLAQGRTRDDLSRVFFNGNIVHFSPEHLVYAIPAILILSVIGVLPPLVLLGYPLVNRVFIAFKMENSRVAKCLNHTSKLKPLLDSFQGCFKDRFRFFAGIYFFYRWVAVIVYAIVSKISLFYTVTLLFLILLLVVHCICQPYQKRWHNILDALLFANLIVINGLTSQHYFSKRVDVGIYYGKIIAVSQTVQVILIYLPLVYMAVYIATQLLSKTLCKGVKEKPSEEDFMLKKIGKKIYRLSVVSTKSEEFEESLPYRLINKIEDSSFEESLAAKEDVVIDTYL